MWNHQKGAKMVIVKVYDIYNNTHEWEVRDIEKAREYAKRIVVEGLWYKDGDEEIFFPVHKIVKVKLIPDKGK